MDVLAQVLNAPPVSPRRLNPQVDPDLEAICLKCLEKNAGDRYRSAAAPLSNEGLPSSLNTSSTAAPGSQK